MEQIVVVLVGRFGASGTHPVRNGVQFVDVPMGRFVPQERIRNAQWYCLSTSQWARPVRQERIRDAQWRSLLTSQGLPVEHYGVEGSLEFHPVLPQFLRPPRFSRMLWKARSWMVEYVKGVLGTEDHPLWL